LRRQDVNLSEPKPARPHAEKSRLTRLVFPDAFDRADAVVVSVDDCEVNEVLEIPFEP
jgi:hypothetical protein